MNVEIIKETRGNDVIYYAKACGEIAFGNTEKQAISNLNYNLYYKLKVETYNVEADIGIGLEEYKPHWYSKLCGMIIWFFYDLNESLYGTTHKW